MGIVTVQFEVIDNLYVHPETGENTIIKVSETGFIGIQASNLNSIEIN